MVHTRLKRIELFQSDMAISMVMWGGANSTNSIGDVVFLGQAVRSK
jgi:hypothetical protein